MLLGTELGTGITGLACGSATRCVVVDGAGEAVGFNPRSPGKPKPVQVLNDSAVGVVCPSASECVLASSGGERVTFALSTATAAPILKQGAISNARVDTAQPTALACPDSTYCLLVIRPGAPSSSTPGARERRPPA